MNMELNSEELSGCNDQTVVKGKRSKRPRPSSSASSTGGGELNCNSVVSSTSSGISISADEDVDMANCLILLARGGGGGGSQTAEDDEIGRPPENKFTSRRFAEITTATAAAATIGKVGVYVYECKTCNRAFPSFQALGGHRASHKKPKPIGDSDKKISAAAASPEEGNFSVSAATGQTQSPNKSFGAETMMNKPKIHECSICGSEFGSGQALGGHMRRHRSAANSNSSTTVRSSANDSSSQLIDEIGEDDQKRRNNVLVLDLDLNMPAPPEDDEYLSNQRRRLVFSAAALVDCHY